MAFSPAVVSRCARLSVWLGDTLATLSRVANVGDNKSRSLTYDLNFGVTGGGSLGATVSIIPVSASVSTSRNDVQHLKVVIGTAKPAGNGGGNGGVGNLIERYIPYNVPPSNAPLVSKARPIY